MPVAVVRFNTKVEALSCAILNGGSTTASAFFVMQVPRDYDNMDPAAHAAMVRDILALPEDSVGMMTAAEVRHVFNVSDAEYDGISVQAAATAGLSNQVVAGDVLDNYPERRTISDKRSARLAGTINVAVFSPVPLTEEGKVNMFMPLVEGKTAALMARGFRETGTTSDAMAVFSPVGPGKVSYTGTGSDIGIAAARAVRRAVGTALESRGEHPVLEEPFRVLRNAGYDLARLRAMSGSGIDEEGFREKASIVLANARVRAMLDLVLVSADRADSMAEDGSPEERDILRRTAETVFGDVPPYMDDTVEAVLTAFARFVVIDND